ncbi:MAG: lipid-A-disaccharide synthase [Pyrinomonadaceae bacterium]
MKIMLVAGEASGDAHAAKLVNALREGFPAINFEFFGAVSHQLREAGVEQTVNADDFSIVGLPEITRALPMFWKAFQILKKEAITRKPDAVILIDFPDFNLKLAKSLKKEGFKVIYYISPQLWAWRKYRVKIIKQYVDLLLTILPFEKDWYAKQNITHVEYVGNPLAKEVYSTLSRDEFCKNHNLDSAKAVIALLAGSRHKEIVRILPVMLETASLMSGKNQDLQFVIALPSTRKLTEAETAIAEAQTKGLKLPKTLITVKNETREALNASDVAAVTSGTATLETAIIGTPMTIVYKSSPLNYKLLRPLINVEHFGLINLIAQERLAKELIQDDFTGETLAEELFHLLEPETNKIMRERLRGVVETLGHGGASKRAATAIMRELENAKKQ